MKKTFIIIFCLIAFLSLVEHFQSTQSYKKLSKVIENGFILVDDKGTVHTNFFCANRVGAIKQLEISYSKKYYYCSCIPPDSLKILEKSIELTATFTNRNGNKCTFLDENDEEIFVSVSNLLLYGISAYVDAYPNFKIRMQDKGNQDYLIPLKSIHRALNDNLKIYSFCSE